MDREDVSLSAVMVLFISEPTDEKSLFGFLFLAYNDTSSCSSNQSYSGSGGNGGCKLIYNSGIFHFRFEPTNAN